jgi:transcriptional regulator with XRE-family HTH domain
MADVAGVGERIRSIRMQQQITLAALASSTGISESTLSRLENGKRRATLELLLDVAAALKVPLDDFVSAPVTEDPRVPQRRITRRSGTVMIPLTRRAGQLHAYKMLLPPSDPDARPHPGTHDGYEWLYVLSGRVYLLLGDEEVELEAGEVAEFDTRLPHLVRNPGPSVAELLTLFGPQGERMHVRASSSPRG